MNIGSLLLSRSWSRSKAEIKRKGERTTDSRDASNNVGAINGAAVPCAGSGVSSFDEDGIGATLANPLRQM